MLHSRSGATVAAWLGDGGSCGHRTHEMWALLRQDPLQLITRDTCTERKAIFYKRVDRIPIFSAALRVPDLMSETT